MLYLQTSPKSQRSKKLSFDLHVYNMSNMVIRKVLSFVFSLETWMVELNVGFLDHCGSELAIGS